MSEGKYAEALECFDKGTLIRPPCIGLMLPYLNYLDLTLSCIEKMIQEQPDFVEAWYIKARILFHSLHHADALTAVNAALEKDPNHKTSQELRNEILQVLTVPSGE